MAEVGFLQASNELTQLLLVTDRGGANTEYFFYNGGFYYKSTGYSTNEADYTQTASINGLSIDGELLVDLNDSNVATKCGWTSATFTDNTPSSNFAAAGTSFADASTASVTLDYVYNARNFSVTWAITGAASEVPTVTSVYTAQPNAPTSLSASAGNGEATISFTAPSDLSSFNQSGEEDNAITNYEYTLDNGTTWTALSPSDATSPVVVPGLTNGVTYSIKLRAVNGVGSGLASAAVSVTPVGPDNAAPSFDVAPTVGSVTSSGFTPSASIDEAGEIYYVVVADGVTAPSAAQVKAGQDATGSLALASANVTVSSSPFTSNFSAITSLTASTAYDVYFIAEDDEGTPNVQSSVTKVDASTSAAPDTTAPTATFSPANAATNVAVDANITITFNEAIRLVNDSALTDSNVDALITLKDTNSSGSNIAFDATVSGNVITVNPTSDFSTSQQVYVAIGATVEDSSDNAYAGGSATFGVVANTNSPATEFASNEAAIRRQIQTVALQSIRNSVQEATDFMISARERFRVCRSNEIGAKSNICSTNVPFDIDGSTSISTSSANVGGSFFGQFGNFDGSYRRMTSGDFNIQRDSDGNTTGALSGRIAWEYLSDHSMLGWFVGAEYAQSNLAGTFTGDQNSFGASLGGYFVSEVQDQLFLDGHLTFKQNEHELQLSNGTLDLDSVYHSSTILTGLTLTGVTAINEEAELSPTLSLNAARTDLGTIGFTGVAYGLTDSTLSMDGGAVSYADISFAPKYRVAMDGQSLPSSLLVATFAPRAICEYVELTGSTTRSCGSGLSLGLLGTAANGNGSLEFEVALDKVGGELRHSVGMSASLQY